jgi:putative transposase
VTTQFRKERHSVTDLKLHLVCVTKYRRSVFTAKSLELIKKSFNEVSEKMDFRVLEFNGESDHVHALIEFPPKLSVSQIVNALKGVSSRRYGQAGYTKPHKEALWSPSYFAISVGGAPLEVLKEYITNQEKPLL